MTPFAISLAFLNSSFSPNIEAWAKSKECFLYNNPKPAQEITPTPPSFATAEAKPDSDTPTPIPPWTMGNLISRLPIEKLYIFFVGNVNIKMKIHTIPCKKNTLLSYMTHYMTFNKK
ncbi:hypothetical protein SDC9_92680 [bioreactor metagenome]|uniref:Uncharacterized protein n=1 Tax=bioreactor metagenome TaxID=1076179 RepID=A0A644ZZ96_9ZZZZ